LSSAFLAFRGGFGLRAAAVVGPPCYQRPMADPADGQGEHRVDDGPVLLGPGVALVLARREGREQGREDARPAVPKA
jgi:hypothetical protein